MRPISLVLILIFSVAVSAQSKSVDTSAASSTPLSIAIVVDNSGSYRTIFDRVVKATAQIVDDVRAGDEGFLLTFVDTSKIVLRQGMTFEKSDLQDAVENMFIEGGATSILDAVVFASKHLAEHSTPGDRARVMILITDGDERESAATLEDAVKAARAANVRIFALGLYEEKFYPKVIDRLIKETGGAKFVPKVPKDTPSAVTSLLSAMRTR